MRHLLFLAYYFPPLGMGGVQRALKLARYLPQFGWVPHVVTVKDIRYYAQDPSLLEEIGHIPVYRAESLDPARLAWVWSPKNKESSTDLGNTGGNWSISLSKLLSFFLYPDTKLLWLPFARQVCTRIQKETKIEAVFSTSPPVSGHLLAAKLGLPWIADFRDYWTIGDGIYAPTPLHRWRYRSIMKKICSKADALLAVSDPIATTLREFCRESHPDKVTVLPNGFDPNDLQHIAPIKNDRFTILYAGNLNQKRSPLPFFKALVRVVQQRPGLSEHLRVVFIGQHFGDFAEAVPESIRHLVEFKGYLSHRETIAHLKAADVLLLLLSPDNAPGVVTGKVYEYLGVHKPIFAIVPSHCAVHALLSDFPLAYLASPEDEAAVTAQLENILENWMQPSKKPALSKDVVSWLQQFSRQHQAGRVADLLNRIIEEREP